MKSVRHVRAIVAALAILGGACTSDNGIKSNGSGGSEGTGGAASTGGTVGSGGKPGSGGADGTGGSVGTGGKPGTGGSEGTGGQVGSGGASSRGGALGVGGAGTGGGGGGTTPVCGKVGQACCAGNSCTDGCCVNAQCMAASACAGTPDGGPERIDAPPAGRGGSAGAGVDGRQGTGGAAGSTGTPPTGGAGGASPGCGSSNTTSPCGVKGTTCSLTVSGTARTYYVQLPSSYSSSKQYPVIFQFHPWGGSADQALTMYSLNSKIPDAIYVTPQGVQAGSGGPGWANTNGQDIAFTKAMLADIQSKYCVDNSRIFSTGFSYGGMMSFAIGCEMSDVFRAIAPMSGSLYSDTNCKGTGPHIAMWGSHGTSDTVVPIADGRSALKKILQQNKCGTTTKPVDPSPCVKYDGCDAGYDVTWCEWDGSHGIPSFGSAAIAAFFKQF